MILAFVPTMGVDKRAKQTRYMVWGGVDVGKTTLINALAEVKVDSARKTQMVDYQGIAIDTPGEYAERGHLRRYLQAAANDARLLLVVVDATQDETRFPPNYFLMFSQPVIGVVNKIDIATDAQVKRATKLLRQSGAAGEVFLVSAINGSGLSELRRRLFNYLD
jgi:ethanolamine utilization protein EutP